MIDKFVLCAELSSRNPMMKLPRLKRTLLKLYFSHDNVMRDYVYTTAARLDGFSINDARLIQNSVIPEEIALLVLSFKTIYKI